MDNIPLSPVFQPLEIPTSARSKGEWCLNSIVLYSNCLQTNHWLLGQAWNFREPSGQTLEDILSIPNDGVVLYRSFFNDERLLITDPKALAEVLVSKCYGTFARPKFVTVALRRILGNGMLLAEGDAHKVLISSISLFKTW